MKLFSFFLCILAFNTDKALGRLEVTNEFPGGWGATLFVPIFTPISQWRCEFYFDKRLDDLQVYTANIEGEVDKRDYVIVNRPGEGNAPIGEYEIRFQVAYTGNRPHLQTAIFNGEEVDTGYIPPSTTTTRPTRPTGPPGTYDYGEVITYSLEFYEAQRCGRLPADNRIPWRNDSFLDDGQDNGLDLTGGYFDAGDHVKFGFPMASFTTILNWGLIDYEEGYNSALELENARKAVRWSLDYFIKAHPTPNEFYGQVGDGSQDHSFWGRPEDWPHGPRPSWKITTDKPGSDLAGETAAAFASGYLAFQRSDPAYAAELLRHAKELYDFANNYRGKYTDAIPAGGFYDSWSGYGDELGWSAAWLYRATNDQKYLRDVEAHFLEFGLEEKPLEFSWDDKKAGLHVLLAKITGEQKYKDEAEAFCNFIVDDIPRTPKGLAHISMWGSLRHVSNCAFICLQAADAGINPMKYRTFAKEQIHYILGSTGRSFVCGYGDLRPEKPHHRASSCPSRPDICDWNSGMNNPGANYQILYGALVGGPDAQDHYVDDRNDFIHNEVATDYNGGFQSALAALQFLKYTGQLP